MQLKLRRVVVIALLILQVKWGLAQQKLSFFKRINVFNKETGNIPKDSSELKLKKLNPAEMKLLFSYYEQDGNNSAVTGGIGTEKLTDLTPKIIVKIPINQRWDLNADAGFDYYSSASTDNIDNNVSSASSVDIRGHANVGFTYTPGDNGMSYGLKTGYSAEYDYTSFNFGGNIAKLSKDGNKEFSFAAQAFIDRWYLYYPVELRRQGPLVPTDRRQSYNVSLGYSQVINPRLQASVSLEGIYMRGLLSTPFHRVFFQEQAQAKVEMLPSSRLKIPIGIRLNYFAHEKLLMRLYYRYYWDNWGVQAHTASMELPFKINRFFSIYPYYRFHTQTAADYFKPYKQHSLADIFYTSDYDLAALQSHTIGLGTRYSPVEGISKTNFLKREIIFKSIDLRYAHYSRSTGLKGNIVSLGMEFNF